MSNNFKPNSRFAALVETSPPQKKEKNDRDQKDKEKASKDNEEPKFSCFRPLDENEKERRRLKREMEFQKQKEFAEAEKERIKSISLQINTTNFPELFLDSKQDNIISNGETYLDKLKHKEVASNNHDDPDLENVRPGWFILKRDKLTGKTLIKKTQVKNVIVEADEELVEAGKEANIDITDELIKLHVKRTQEYIDNYGYEEWEKMFKVPNWREEEEYLVMMEQAFGVSDNLIDSDYEYENGSDYDYDC